MGRGQSWCETSGAGGGQLNSWVRGVEEAQLTLLLLLLLLVVLARDEEDGGTIGGRDKALLGWAPGC